jgi:hypothetical protein
MTIELLICLLFGTLCAATVIPTLPESRSGFISAWELAE